MCVFLSECLSEYPLNTTGSCPDGTQPVNCVVNPCQWATCPVVKGAICVADYCGGCNTLWVLNGEAVSHLCGGKFSLKRIAIILNTFSLVMSVSIDVENAL